MSIVSSTLSLSSLCFWSLQSYIEELFMFVFSGGIVTHHCSTSLRPFGLHAPKLLISYWNNTWAEMPIYLKSLNILKYVDYGVHTNIEVVSINLDIK